MINNVTNNESVLSDFISFMDSEVNDALVSGAHLWECCSKEELERMAYRFSSTSDKTEKNPHSFAGSMVSCFSDTLNEIFEERIDNGESIVDLLSLSQLHIFKNEFLKSTITLH